MKKLFVSNKDESVRLFQSDFLEALTKVHPATPLIIFVPVVAYCLYKASFVLGTSLYTLFLYFLFGLFIWTLAEYSLHRFLFHLKPMGLFSERVLFIFHGIHHDHPKDSRRLVMPPSASIPLALFFVWVFKIFLLKEHFYAFYGGFITGYLFYDMGHYAIHHFSLRNKFLVAIKNHHLKHHYQNNERGYGVSTPLWDFILSSEFKDEIKAEAQSDI